MKAKVMMFESKVSLLLEVDKRLTLKGRKQGAYFYKGVDIHSVCRYACIHTFFFSMYSFTQPLSFPVRGTNLCLSAMLAAP